MPIAEPQGSLRERTRRAVQNELLDAAQELFATVGYEDVTVEQIAAAAGISRRSFFRYFGSKEALVLGKYERQGEQFVSALAARPLDEPDWVSLRRMLDDTVAYVSDPVLGERTRTMQAIINASDSLRAGYLERMQRAQAVVVEQLRHRSAERGDPLGSLDAAAIVGAAFACLTAAYSHSDREGRPLALCLDEAMDAVARSAR